MDVCLTLDGITVVEVTENLIMWPSTEHAAQNFEILFLHRYYFGTVSNSEPGK